MRLNIKTMKINILDLVAFVMIMLLTIFPIFRSYGMIIQNYGLWILGIIGLLLSVLKGYICFNRFLFGYMLYIAFSAISIFWSVNYSGAFTRILNMLQVLLVGIYLVSYCEYKNNIQKVLNYYICGTSLISVYCFIQDMSTLSTWSRLGKVSFEAAGQNQVYYTCILIYTIIIVIHRIFENEKRGIYVFLFAFLYMCGILTAVRKCMLIPILFGFFYVLFKYKKRASKLIKYLMIAVICCLVGYYLISRYVPSMYSRLQSLIIDLTSGADANVNGNSYEMRKWLREQAWQQFKNHPVLGVGIGQFRYYASAGGLDLYAHNNFLEILANTGIVGFFIYYGSMFQLLLRTLFVSNGKDRREISNGCFVAAFLLAVLAMEYGQVDYYQMNFICLPVIMCNLVDDYRLKFFLREDDKYLHNRSRISDIKS